MIITTLMKIATEKNSNMLPQFSERQMHFSRWVLTVAWLLVIVSLFYDPWTSVLTAPNHPWSPLRLPDTCIQVQGKC